MERIWDHSLTVAKTARLIMLRLTSAQRLANDAFTAGLLHDIGRIVLATNLPADYREVLDASRESGLPLHMEEIRQFGINHTQVGAYLLGIWGMPAALVETAALHHAPSHTETPEISLLTAVHVANVLAHAQRPDDEGIPDPALDVEYLENLGLPITIEAWQLQLREKTVAAPGPAPLSEPERAIPPQPPVAAADTDVTGPIILTVVLVIAITALTVVWIMSRH
jgi:putative nucleotidyltransferase with HDIG domain